MSVLSLLRARNAADFADWFRPGAEYLLRVADGMGFRTGDLAGFIDEAETAMRAGRTGADVAPTANRLIAADLYADAAFGLPFLEWTPVWYELGLTAPTAYAGWQLRRIADQYAATIDHISVPRFSRPGDVVTRGRPAVESVSGFADRFAFADAILHLEWFAYVAEECGINVPADMVAETRRETVAYYVGDRSLEELDPSVRRFQTLLFTDDEWIRDLDDRYGLGSTLLSVWARVCRRERERFGGV
ncbi:hypothetical protein [Halobellus ordinarius]|uniref:hypothetical protein n=1 Tax=Halobellus ordinarius TaxID=3075120 RepID=UPI002880B1F1|nr:hypothetical protein [Halobellus sp. ZY16]